MRISAILFALPAALLRKTRRTKRDPECDAFSEDANAGNKNDLTLITGCLSKSEKCRVFVVPNPPNHAILNEAHDHDVDGHD